MANRSALLLQRELAAMNSSLPWGIQVQLVQGNLYHWHARIRPLIVSTKADAPPLWLSHQQEFDCDVIFPEHYDLTPPIVRIPRMGSRHLNVRPHDGTLVCPLLQYWLPGTSIEMLLVFVQQLLAEPMLDACPANPNAQEISISLAHARMPLALDQPDSNKQMHSKRPLPVAFESFKDRPRTPPVRVRRLQFEDYRQCWESLATTISDKPRVRVVGGPVSKDSTTSPSSEGRRKLLSSDAAHLQRRILAFPPTMPGKQYCMVPIADNSVMMAGNNGNVQLAARIPAKEAQAIAESASLVKYGLLHQQSHATEQLNGEDWAWLVSERDNTTKIQPPRQCAVQSSATVDMYVGSNVAPADANMFAKVAVIGKPPPTIASRLPSAPIVSCTSRQQIFVDAGLLPEADFKNPRRNLTFERPVAGVRAPTALEPPRASSVASVAYLVKAREGIPSPQQPFDYKSQQSREQSKMHTLPPSSSKHGANTRHSELLQGMPPLPSSQKDNLQPNDEDCEDVLAWAVNLPTEPMEI